MILLSIGLRIKDIFMVRKEYIWIFICSSLVLLLVMAASKIVQQRNVLARNQNPISVEHDVMPGDPPVRSSEDVHGDKSHFTFSPDRTMIAFVENVFKDYGYDWEKYWALKIFTIAPQDEKVVFVDDTHLSFFQWLNNTNIRVFHGSGTGVRVYKDISVQRTKPLFSNKYRGEEFWIVDEAYSKEAQGYVEAERVYRAYEDSL
jgi:hypothetical protein